MAWDPGLTSGLACHFGLARTSLDCGWSWLLPLDLPWSLCLAPTLPSLWSSPVLPSQDHTVTHGAVLNLMTVGSVCGTKGGLILMPVKIQKAIANKSQWEETQVLQGVSHAGWGEASFLACCSWHRSLPAAYVSFFPISPQVFWSAHKRKDRSALFSLSIREVAVSPPTLKHVWEAVSHPLEILSFPVGCGKSLL